jgi:uncharacterized protein YdhG (YjbR/CyaY superfamily)
MNSKKPENIDEYISSFPEEVQKLLNDIRSTIRKAAPDATESISYAIPTFKLNGSNLVHFAAFKEHIGFYATPTGHEAFEKKLSKYKQGKGSVQFPLDEPMPHDLIKKIVKFRVEQELEKQKARSKKAKAKKDN